jgi:hypothetical protein
VKIERKRVGKFSAQIPEINQVALIPFCLKILRIGSVWLSPYGKSPEERQATAPPAAAITSFSGRFDLDLEYRSNSRIVFY